MTGLVGSHRRCGHERPQGGPARAVAAHAGRRRAGRTHRSGGQWLLAVAAGGHSRVGPPWCGDITRSRGVGGSPRPSAACTGAILVPAGVAHVSPTCNYAPHCFSSSASKFDFSAGPPRSVPTRLAGITRQAFCLVRALGRQRMNNAEYVRLRVEQLCLRRSLFSCSSSPRQ